MQSTTFRHQERRARPAPSLWLARSGLPVPAWPGHALPYHRGRGACGASCEREATAARPASGHVLPYVMASEARGLRAGRSGRGSRRAILVEGEAQPCHRNRKRETVCSSKRFEGDCEEEKRAGNYAWVPGRFGHGLCFCAFMTRSVVSRQAGGREHHPRQAVLSRVRLWVIYLFSIGGSSGFPLEIFVFFRVLRV